MTLGKLERTVALLLVSGIVVVFVLFNLSNRGFLPAASDGFEFGARAGQPAAAAAARLPPLSAAAAKTKAAFLARWARSLCCQTGARWGPKCGAGLSAKLAVRAAALPWLAHRFLLQARGELWLRRAHRRALCPGDSPEARYLHF